MRFRVPDFCLFFFLFLSTASFGQDLMLETVKEKHSSWVRAIERLGPSQENCDVYFKMREFKAITDLGLQAIPALVALNEKDPWLGAAILVITKVKLREKCDINAPGYKVYPDFPEVTHPKNLIKQWWSNIRPSVRAHFQRFYSAWKETNHSEPKALPARLERVACLGVDVLPFLIEKISEGDLELIKLVSDLTGGEVPPSATPVECQVWWESNHNEWTIPPS